MRIVCGLPWFLVLLFCGATLAQHQSRVPLVGVVVGAGGEPWPDAEVVLVSRALAGCAVWGPGDQLRGRTDERGTFRIQVLAEAGYAGFAWRSSKSGGEATELAEALVAGVPARLKGAVVQAPRQIELKGLEAYGGTAGKRVEVEVTGHHPWIEPVTRFTGDGTIHLPVLPPVPLKVRVFDQDHPLVEFEVPVSDSGLPRTVPMPQRFHAVFKDLFSGEAVPGVVVSREFGEARPVLGVSDADGRVEFHVPLDTDLGDFWPSLLRLGLRADAPGRRPLVLLDHEGFVAPRVRAGLSAARRDGKTLILPFALERAEPWQGLVAAADGRGIPNLPLLLRASDGTREWLRTDQEGRFRVRPSHPDIRYRMSTATIWLAAHGGPGRMAADLPSAGPLAAETLLAVTPSLAFGLAQEIRIDRLVRLEVSVRTFDGLPAAAPWVAARTPPSTGPWPGPPLLDRTDRLGRLVLFVPPHGRIQVAAGVDGAMDEQLISLAGQGGKSIAVALCLCDRRILKGRFIDEQGAGLAGAQVCLMVSSSRVPPGEDLGRLVRGADLLPGVVQTTTGGDGTFELSVPSPLSKLTVIGRLGGRTVNGIVELEDGAFPPVLLRLAR